MKEYFPLHDVQNGYAKRWLESNVSGTVYIDQFTGLQDKNSVDIYGSDITKTVSELLRPFDRSVKTRTGEYITKYNVVEYRDDQSCFCFVGCPITGISQQKATKWHEVIGNKYQNPEFLNERPEV